MSKYLKISEVANELGVSVQTVRRYANEGKLEFDKTPGGQRVFTKEHINSFLGVKNNNVKVFYVRSSKGSRVAMDNQIQELENNFGTPDKVYKDTGSGLNEKRKNLNKLLDDIQSEKVDVVYVTHIDRLTRFGLRYIQRMANEHNVSIIALNNDKTGIYEELISDFMDILASFGGRYYRLRSKDAQQKFLSMAEEVLKSEDQRSIKSKAV